MQYFHQADTNGDGEVDDDEFRSVSLAGCLATCLAG